MLNTQQLFPQSRYMHCHNVGLRMYYYAKYNLKKSEKFCQDMFVLGCLHDIGYELNPDAFLHDIAMTNSLVGYKYKKEIKYHSYMQTEYDSLAMRLLYFGDMTVDAYGNWCTLEERLNDLANRHGINSDVYIESKRIAYALIKWGFDDSIPQNIVPKIN